MMVECPCPQWQRDAKGKAAPFAIFFMQKFQVSTSPRSELSKPSVFSKFNSPHMSKCSKNTKIDGIRQQCVRSNKTCLWISYFNSIRILASIPQSGNCPPMLCLQAAKSNPLNTTQLVYDRQSDGNRLWRAIKCN